MLKGIGVHISLFKITVACRVVKMMVGIDYIAHRLIRQRLQILTDVARTVAGVDGNTFILTYNQIRKVTGRQHLPCIGGNLFCLKPRLIHMGIRTIRIFNQNVMFTGKIDHIDPLSFSSTNSAIAVSRSFSAEPGMNGVF